MDILGIVTSCSEVDGYVDTDLEPRLVEDKGEDATGDWFQDGDVRIKRFLPKDKCSTKCSALSQGEQIVMPIFRIQEKVVGGEETF